MLAREESATEFRGRVYDSILALEAPRYDDDHALTAQVTTDAAAPIKEQLTRGMDELRKAS